LSSVAVIRLLIDFASLGASLPRLPAGPIRPVTAFALLWTSVGFASGFAPISALRPDRYRRVLPCPLRFRL